jgi:hypothetical protein
MLFRRFRASKSRPLSFRPQVEALEDRCLLSTFDWVGAGANSNWNNPANWEIGKATNNNTTPGVGDTARFSNSFNPKNPNAVVNAGTGGVEIARLSVGTDYKGTITLDQRLMVDSRFRVNGGTFDGPANLVLGNNIKSLAANGTIRGTATFKGVTGSNSLLHVTAGSTLYVHGGGTVTFDKRSLIVSAGSTLTIDGSTINLNTATLTDHSVLTLSNTVNLNSTGKGQVRALAGMNLPGTSPTANVAVNVPITLQGAVALSQDSTLTFTAGGTIASPFQLGSSSKLVFAAGTGQTPASYTWNKGTKITGKAVAGGLPGSQVIITGNVALADANTKVTIATVKLSVTGSTLTGQTQGNSGSYIALTSSTFSQFAGVTLSQLKLYSYGPLSITGNPAAGMTLKNQALLDLNGETLLQGGVIALQDKSTVKNYGEFTLQGFSGILGDTGTKVINEATGTLIRTGDKNTSLISAPAGVGILENLGLIRIDQGILKAPGLVQKGKGETRDNGGNIQVNDPMSLEGGLLDNVGDSAQNGEVIGDVVNSGGDVEPGGPVAPGYTGILTVTGNYTQKKKGTLTIVLDGLNPGAGYDQLVVNGKVTLAGKLDVVAAPGFVLGASYTIINNQGSGQFIQGTFDGLPEGGKIMLQGQQYFITYVGGPQFNDVILAPAQVTLIKLNDNITGVISYNDGQGHSGSEDVYIAQFNVTLTTGPNRSVTFNTFCIDLTHNVTVGQTYAVDIRNDVAGAFVNGSRMEYIYEQYGMQDLSGNPDQAAAVQLAEWDLLLNNHDPQSFSLDPGTTSVYSSGDPNVFSVDLGSNPDAAKIAGLVDTYLKASIGAKTQGAWLDASASGDALNRGQSLLVPESALNQLVPPALLPPSSPNAGPVNGPALDTFFAVYAELQRRAQGTSPNLSQLDGASAMPPIWDSSNPAPGG